MIENREGDIKRERCREDESNRGRERDGESMREGGEKDGSERKEAEGGTERNVTEALILTSTMLNLSSSSSSGGMGSLGVGACFCRGVGEGTATVVRGSCPAGCSELPAALPIAAVFRAIQNPPNTAQKVHKKSALMSTKNPAVKPTKSALKSTKQPALMSTKNHSEFHQKLL